MLSRITPLAECMRIAAAQHGVISWGQALATGLSRSSLHRLSSSGSWKRLRPCDYRLWKPSTATDVLRQQLMAAALWLGEGSAVSHRAAAVLWELDGIDAAPLELTTTGRRRSSAPGVLVHRVRTLTCEEIAIESGIPVTSLARTVVDLAAVMDPDNVELALESALRSGRVTVAQISDQLVRSGRTVAGRGVVRSLLNEGSTVATESELEALVWRTLVDGGLPVPVRQHEIFDDGGRFVARVDFAYPEARVVIEADGYRFHSSRTDWGRDRARQNALVELGWTILRVTCEDISRDSPHTVAQVRAVLAACGRSGARKRSSRSGEA